MAIQDVISELNRLKSEGLISDYALGGAVAAYMYIETAATQDVDVFVIVAPPEGDTLNPLVKVNANLVARGFPWTGPYFTIGDWPVQFLLPTLGKPLYEDAIVNARTKDFDNGVFGRIMGPEHLVALALDAGYDKHYVRIAEFVRRKKVDMPTLMAMVERFGLTNQWKKFQTRFPVDND